MPDEELNPSYDVVVIGGGAAGLNGALMLARSRRTVVVIDAGQPRNAPASAVHGLLARDGTPPAELLERGRAEVRSYGGVVVSGVVATASRPDADALFRVGLEDGRTVSARRLLVTTGVLDELPDIAGLRERWGRDVVHCPYCHGWEVRDQAIGVIATHPMAVHQALLFRQLSDDVTVFTHTVALTVDDRERLRARGIRVLDGQVSAVRSEDDRIASVALADGRVVARTVVTVQSRAVARAGFLTELGLIPVEHPMGMGTSIVADQAGQSSVPGVYLAGNVSDLGAQVGSAAAAGALAGARINADLVEEETGKAVAMAPAEGEDHTSQLSAPER